MVTRARNHTKARPSNDKPFWIHSFPGMAGACGIAIFLIVLLIYIPALNNSFVNWDDNVYVYENSRLDTLNLTFLYWMFTALYEANWHPLTWLSHAVDYALFGLTPFGHHLISIILH